MLPEMRSPELQERREKAIRIEVLLFEQTHAFLS